MKEKLIEIGNKIIDSENLPKTEIKIKSPLYGTRKRKGVCYDYFGRRIRKIIVNITKSRFIEDEDGDFVYEKGGKKYRRLLGVGRSLDDVKYTFAHEIAHLKIMKHNSEHANYTKHILSLINKEMV